MGFLIECVRLHQIRMPLVHFFETSFGRTTKRQIILVEVVSDGLSGWGEVTCGENPFYNEEWTDAAWLLLRDYLAPALARRRLERADEVAPLFDHIRGHRMARGGVEAAVWDLEARQKGVPLWQHIGGGAHREIACGVSIGIQNSVEQLLDKIAVELSAGYQRIKVKIKPGWDVEVVAAIRKRFAGIALSADANSAYTLADTGHLQRLDEFNLMMIEQPLGHDDILDHALLRPELKTPLCLDECIRSSHHAGQAILMRACGILNIKLGRVGGFREARLVHDVAQAAEVPVWCGGMLESGVGRAHNIALSTLPNFLLPGDISASKRYWAEDIIDPEVQVTPRGTIEVSSLPGLGYDLKLDRIQKLTVRRETVV
jgi:o-succinylbenzoate synthase